MRGKAFVLGLSFGAFVAPALAQQLPLEVRRAYPQMTESAPVSLHHQVAEVAVQLAVTDRSGEPVTELHADDLQVLESGVPAVITALRREDELPLRVALVIDWSDSVQKNLNFEREVALDFLRKVLRPKTDEAMVVGFRCRVEVTQGLTGNLQSLEAGLRPVVGVSLSSVYDAVIAAADALRNADPRVAQRRAILLLSDGEDNVSAHGLPDVIQAAQRANVTIYAITPAKWRPKSARRDVLTELTRLTGGQTFFISHSPEQLAFAMVRRDLETGYTVYFKPAAAGGAGLRPLEVSAKRKNLQVWAQRSYYARPD